MLTGHGGFMMGVLPVRLNTQVRPYGLCERSTFSSTCTQCVLLLPLITELDRLPPSRVEPLCVPECVCVCAGTLTFISLIHLIEGRALDGISEEAFLVLG